MRRFGAALVISVLLVSSGCSSTSRPSQSEISNALRKGGDNAILGAAGSAVSKEAADCIAKVLVESNISDRALRAIVDGKKDYRATKQDTAAAVSVRDKIVACLPVGLGSPSG